MQHILITGIEGFVGKNFASYLYFLGYKLSGTYFIQPEHKIGSHYYCNISHYNTVLNIIKTVRPDVIFHLAAQSSVSESEKNIPNTFATNVQGTLNILEAVRETAIKPRIFYISSCEVYGRSDKKLTEKSLTQPISFYAMSKLSAEEVCKYYGRVHQLDIVILRPFSHTGPGQAEHFIFPRVAKKIAEIEAGRAEPVLTLGNIAVKRDYTDIEDITNAYALAITHCQTGEIYNVTSEKTYSLKDGVEFLLDLSFRKIELEIDKNLIRNNDIPLLTGSAQKFIKETGWKPQIDFYATLTDLLDYYRTIIKKQLS